MYKVCNTGPSHDEVSRKAVDGGKRGNERRGGRSSHKQWVSSDTGTGYPDICIVLACVLTTNNYLIIYSIHLGKYICLDKQILFVFCVCSVYKARSERGGAIITYSIVKIIHYLEGSCFSYLQNMCAIFVKAGFMGRCEDVVRAQSLICRHRYLDNIFG